MDELEKFCVHRPLSEQQKSNSIWYFAPCLFLCPFVERMNTGIIGLLFDGIMTTTVLKRKKEKEVRFNFDQSVDDRSRIRVPLTLVRKPSRLDKDHWLIKIEWLILVVKGERSLADYSDGWFDLPLFIDFIMQTFCSDYRLMQPVRCPSCPSAAVF